MNRERRTTARSWIGFGALTLTLFVATLLLILGSAGAGYASEPVPTDTAPSSGSASAEPTLSPSVTATSTVTATPTPTDVSTPASSSPAPAESKPSAQVTSSVTQSPPPRDPQRHATEPRAAVQPDAVTVAASPYLVLNAASLDAVGLTYVGTFTVSRPSGDIQVLRFTLTGGSLAGFSLTQACTTGYTTVTTADSATLDGAAFDAVSLAVTVGGTPLTFTVGNPPAQPFPGEIELDEITLTGTTMSADSLHTPSFTTQAATC